MEGREEARGEAIQPHSSSNCNVVRVEKAQENKKPAIETRFSTSEEAEELVAEPSAIPSITTAGSQPRILRRC